MTNKIISIIFFLIFTMFISVTCQKKNEIPKPVSCADPSDQDTATAGSALGNDNNSLDLGSGTIKFSNIDITFYGSGKGNENIDAGDICLAKLTSWPNTGTENRIAARVGHSYLSRFKSVLAGTTTYTYTKFKVISYKSGVITIVYVPHL